MNRRTGVCVLAIAGLTSSLWAVPIPVVNAGFEAQPAPPGCFIVSGVPTGWDVFDPFDQFQFGLNALGVIDPTGTTYFLPGQIPEGNNACLVYCEASVGGGPMGIRQLLGVNLQANTRYRLSVGVGNIASGASPVPPCPDGAFYDIDGFPGYAVQLLAGGEIVDQDDNELFGMIPEGEFRTSVVEVEIPEGHPLIGGELEIRLLNLNEDDPTNEDPGIEVDFDNVMLEMFPVSCAGDCDGSGAVDFNDLVSMLFEFGVPSPLSECDADASGAVDFNDLVAALFLFGPC